MLTGKKPFVLSGLATVLLSPNLNGSEIYKCVYHDQKNNIAVYGLIY